MTNDSIARLDYQRTKKKRCCGCMAYSMGLYISCIDGCIYIFKMLLCVSMQRASLYRLVEKGGERALRRLCAVLREMEE
jgi:hypothetical protein